jgi:hypothetical protein
MRQFYKRERGKNEDQYIREFYRRQRYIIFLFASSDINFFAGSRYSSGCEMTKYYKQMCTEM